MSLEQRISISSVTQDAATGTQDGTLSEVLRDYKTSKGAVRLQIETGATIAAGASPPVQLTQLFGNHDEELLYRQLGPKERDRFDRKDQEDRRRYQQMSPDDRDNYDKLTPNEQWDRDHETPNERYIREHGGR